MKPAVVLCKSHNPSSFSRYITIDVQVDRCGPRRALAQTIAKSLEPFVPTKKLDPKVFEALALVEEGGWTIADATRRVFGPDPRAYHKVRYARNKLGLINPIIEQLNA